jgi:hypothetical protein
MFATIIYASGLSPLIDDTYRVSNKTIVSAFVERWHGETNTFHLPMGEMTITLDDVFCLTGIPVRGTLVRSDALDDPVEFVVEALGVEAWEVEAEFHRFRGQYVRLEWLREKFSDRLLDIFHSWSCGFMST